MDYSQLSDRDIDAQVLHKIYGNQDNDKDIMRSWLRGGFKYTTNPAESWPIIQENGISINHYNGVWEASFEWDAPVGAFGTDETVTTSTEHKNPLRAAMVAYLMMRDVSDVQGNPA
ncbi:phage protein NinX family protein [Citrobacter freundii]|uniref:phage protein NinX family protein n=1 Tax=Citrobacter freundii TaxID=546 RepID=UPI0028BD5BDC|nr:phage protein NinX family protein [Citrobacter freundii]MDT7053696.1 phage protein NinX family protein [Citrobacter freundii]